MNEALTYNFIILKQTNKCFEKLKLKLKAIDLRYPVTHNDLINQCP